MRSCVTISLVEQARGGPFVFWHDLPGAFETAAELGFDAVEVFAPSAEAIDVAELQALSEAHGLPIAALGTGGGAVIHGWTFTDKDPAIRRKARDFVAGIIARAGEFGACAIIGSMQGRWGGDLDRATAREWLGEALQDLGSQAHAAGAQLIFEPLNRYESNMSNTLADGVALLESAGASEVRLLADLFHMNIEEVDLPAAIRAAGSWIGHVHFADSNRSAAGMGHTDFPSIIEALRAIDYRGYLSAEVFPKPDPEAAARQTITAFREYT